MNYLSHAYRFLDDPLYTAGTVVPDWLSVVNRRVRARRKRTEQFLRQPSLSTQLQRIAEGILQHHADDDCFHRSPIFQTLEGQAANEFRKLLPDRYDHRPAFLGHIIVELLIDDFLSAAQPGLMDRFYEVMSRVDGPLVEKAVNLIATRSTDQLSKFIGHFLNEKFLYDYRTDEGLFFRLNQVLHRVRLPFMPENCLSAIAAARQLVAPKWQNLLQYVAKNGDQTSSDK